jgi:hypothetical protein
LIIFFYSFVASPYLPLLNPTVNPYLWAEEEEEEEEEEEAIESIEPPLGATDRGRGKF